MFFFSIYIIIWIFLNIVNSFVRKKVYLLIFTYLSKNKNKKYIEKIQKSKHWIYLSWCYFTFIINFSLCLHLLINSERLFNKISWFGNLMINSFSFKHNLQKFCLGVTETLQTIVHVMWGSLLLRFKSRTYLESSVL